MAKEKQQKKPSLPASLLERWRQLYDQGLNAKLACREAVDEYNAKAGTMKYDFGEVGRAFGWQPPEAKPTKTTTKGAKTSKNVTSV